MEKKGRWLRHGWRVLLVVLLVLLRCSYGHPFWGVVYGIVEPVVLLGGTLWLIIRRKKRREWSYLALVAVWILLFAKAWADLGPRVTVPRHSSSGTEALRVISYNVFFQNQTPDLAIQSVVQEGADVVLLQELTPPFLALFRQAIADQYPYQRVIPKPGSNGLGVFSKYPLEAYEVLGGERYPFAQLMRLRKGDAQLVLANVHAASPAVVVENMDRFWTLVLDNAWRRKRELAKLERDMKSLAASSPMLLAGYLNTLKVDPIYRDLRHRWGDAFGLFPWFRSWTFPNGADFPFPLLSLDYFLYQGPMVAQDTKVISGGSSDHCGIATTIYF